MTRQQRRHAHCLDCGAPVDGNFCSQCGQENSDYRVSLRRLLGDLFEELFQLESRLWRSLAHLFARPGRLTVDYNAGRRVRYTSPLRLYLIASVAYFFVAALLPVRTIDAAGQRELDAQYGPRKLPPPKNVVDRLVRQRLGIVDGADLRQVQRDVKKLLNVNAPKVMSLLVPLFALLTWLLFRRPKLFFVEHLVLALHLHAVAFWVLLVAELSRLDFASTLAMLPLFVWFVLALRALFAQPWSLTILKALALSAVYLSFVIAGIIGALFL
jgi:hypothetical protein